MRLEIAKSRALPGNSLMSSSRIRLLQFVNNFAIGGTERQFVDLAERLRPDTFELHVACLRRWGPFRERVENLGVPVSEYRLKSLYRLDALRERLRFARYARRHKIQIVHTWGFYPNLFAIPAARAAGVPLVVASIRDMGAGLTPLKKRAHRAICRLADCIIANADAVRDWLVAEGYDAEKVAVIPNGIDVSRFPGGGGTGRLQGELGLPPGSRLVAVLSHLSPLKGLGDFLEAASLVATRVPDARFLLVGDRLRADGEQVVRDYTYRKELERTARRLGLDGRVIFTGYRTDVPELLSDVSVSVLPSHTEGLSNTLLESMAAGRPVVATRVGGTPQVVEDGATGLLVPPHDPAGLSRAICLLLEKPELAAHLGREARRSVLERFSIERMVNDTERFYVERLAAKSHRSITSVAEAST